MYMGPSQISFFVYYIGAPSDQLYCCTNRGPSDQFFHLLYGAPLRLVSVLTIWGPLRSAFVHTTCIWEPSQVGFFAYYRGPPRISFFAYYMGPAPPPQVSFFAYYMGASLGQFLRLLCGGPPDQFFSHTIWGPPSGQFLCLLYMEPPQISFFAHYMGAPSDQFLRLLYGGPPQVGFFAYCIGAPLRSVSSHTI